MAQHVPGGLSKKKLAAGNLLRELLLVTRTFPTMPDDVVRKVLFFREQNGLPNQGGMLQRGRKRPRGKNGDKLGKKAQR